MPSPLPALNDDILLEVIAASSRSDQARLMSVSRLFYTHGPRYLLSEPADLETESSMLSFAAFLSAEPRGRRFTLVRQLELSFALFGGPPIPGYDWLGDALSLMVSLQSLGISDTEHGAINYPRVFSAIACLSSLKQLELYNIGKHALTFLSSFRSNLARVTIATPVEGSQITAAAIDVDSWLPFHPTPLLQHSTSTLEELYIFGWHFHPEYVTSADLIYPRMRTLKIDNLHTLPHTLHFTRAFPNLEELSLIISRNPDDGPLLHRRRTQNMGEQDATGCTWHQLRAFTGGLVDLYVLGLACTIERITLTSVPPECVYMLHSVLASARPLQLELSGWPAALAGPGDEFKVEVFQGPGGSRLEVLTIKAQLNGEECADVDVCAVLDGLLDSLKQAPLRVLTLRIFTYHVDAPQHTDANPEDRGLALTVGEQSALALDVEAYVRRLMAAVPTLQAATFVVLGPRRPWTTRKATLADGCVTYEETRERLWWMERGSDDGSDSCY